MAHVQRADNDRPVLIPGARETGASRPFERPQAAGLPRPDRAGAAHLSDPARLERERDGGGASSERSGPPQRTILAWLGDRFGRGIEMLRSAPDRPSSGDGKS